VIQKKVSVSKRFRLKFALIAPLLLCGIEVNAADWLMLQGTQPDMVAPQGVKVPYMNPMPVVFGFIQANYEKDFGDVAISPAGVHLTPFSLLNPNLEDQSGFNVSRARVAVRGMADSENLVNYFLMTDFGNNGVNNLGGHSEVATYFTDASITLKHIPGAKVRAGIFKTPGSEEGLQAVFVSPYIDFTVMTNQQLLERQISDVGMAQTGASAGGAAAVHYTSTKVDKPIAAFRDAGAQVFDTFKFQDDWGLSYAYMYGNGTGIALINSDNQATHYGYLAAEKLFGAGQGYFTESMKFYVWGQSGSRTLNSFDKTTAITTEIEADRKRYGLGMTYYRNGIRFEAEYMKAKGMIFTGPKDVDTNPAMEDWQFQFASGNENEANGGYVNLQYEIIPKKLEVFGRYDFSNRLTNDPKGEREFKTTTLGTSYRFRGATRIDLNYVIKNTEAPGNANAQKVLDNEGNRIAVRITADF
jgi:hypothetical protein